MTSSDAGQQITPTGQSQSPEEALRSLVRGLPPETTSQISPQTIASVVQEKLEPAPEKPVSETVTVEPEKPPEKIAPKAGKATVVHGSKFMYAGEGKQLGVVFDGKALYLESDCLVTNFPDCGELTLDGNAVRWDAILLQETADSFLACGPGDKPLTWKATELTVMTLITCVGTTPIAWGKPYYPRGWVSSLMATVSCKGTLTWRGKQLTVGQNRHPGAFGSCWIEDLKDDAVNPQQFPSSWKTKLQNLPDGTSDKRFQLEVKYVKYLISLGEQPLDKSDEAIVKKRVEKLNVRYDPKEVGLVYRDPRS